MVIPFETSIIIIKTLHNNKVFFCYSLDKYLLEKYNKYEKYD